ncbi:MAG: hypothetical protein PHD83_01040 [Caldisericia bacterium]|nr:hypothetical protein [Caldisericia bacterium]
MSSTTLQIYTKYVGCDFTDMKEKFISVEHQLVEYKKIGTYER